MVSIDLISEITLCRRRLFNFVGFDIVTLLTGRAETIECEGDAIFIGDALFFICWLLPLLDELVEFDGELADTDVDDLLAELIASAESKRFDCRDTLLASAFGTDEDFGTVFDILASLFDETLDTGSFLASLSNLPIYSAVIQRASVKLGRSNGDGSYISAACPVPDFAEEIFCYIGIYSTAMPIEMDIRATYPLCIAPVHRL